MVKYRKGMPFIISLNNLLDIENERRCMIKEDINDSYCRFKPIEYKHKRFIRIKIRIL